MNSKQHLKCATATTSMFFALTEFTHKLLPVFMSRAAQEPCCERLRAYVHNAKIIKIWIIFIHFWLTQDYKQISNNNQILMSHTRIDWCAWWWWWWCGGLSSIFFIFSDVVVCFWNFCSLACLLCKSKYYKKLLFLMK